MNEKLLAYITTLPVAVQCRFHMQVAKYLQEKNAGDYGVSARQFQIWHDQACKRAAYFLRINLQEVNNA